MKFPQTLPFAGDKKLAIELLKLAKDNLREGESYYLCTALTGAATATGAATELDTCLALGDWIRQMVGEGLAYVTQTQEYLDSLNLDLELHDKAPKLAKVKHENAYRLAWADHLISYLETSQ